MSKHYATFAKAYAGLCHEMREYSQPIHTETWQALPISDRPEAEMQELLFVDFQTLLQFNDLDHWRRDIKPNLPWADEHFETERVSGHPINPGETWKDWPWALSADKHRTEGEQFSHSYAERYWPKYAGRFETGGILPEETGFAPHHGIRYDYGDLGDLVEMLLKYPKTRQAYLPVWFPEDTGATHGERVPCSLGYHFMHRNGYLHCFYAIRSCDLVRHMRDDWYLTVRLLLWILDRLAAEDQYWADVKPGVFQFWAGSLHCFTNDFRML